MWWDPRLSVRTSVVFTVPRGVVGLFAWSTLAALVVCCREGLRRLALIPVFVFVFRMSVFDRLTSLIPQVASASGQTKGRSPAPLPPPPSLSPPVVRKNPVHVPSLAQKGPACHKIATTRIISGR